METIKFELTPDEIQVALQKAFQDSLKSSYGNPVSEILKKCFAEKEGVIKKYVDEIITTSLENPEFKSELGKAVMNMMVQSAMKR